MNKLSRGLVAGVVFLFVPFLYAQDEPQEEQELNDGFSTAGLVVIETANTGGTAEIGFPLFRNRRVSIRNYITFSGYGYDSGGILVLGDKVAFGGFGDHAVRAYGFIHGGVGIYKESGKNFLALPLYGEVGGGGGIDLYVNKRVSFCAEAGGGAAFFGRTVTGAAHIAVGFRTFWN